MYPKQGTESLTVGDLTVRIHRTLRLPQDGNTYALPPDMGRFPLFRVADYGRAVPAHWRKDAYFIGMFQREAAWVSWDGKVSAIQVGFGRVNAVSGTPWEDNLIASPQNYMVGPSPQQWLDGKNNGDGTIDQMTAMPLGGGHTVEEQIKGTQFGGLQIAVYSARPGAIQEPTRGRGMSLESFDDGGLEMMSFGAGGGSKGLIGASMGSGVRGMSMAPDSGVSAGSQASEMGLGAGGKMYQKIYDDPYGIEVWERENRRDAYIYIVNIPMFMQITGLPAPECPISAKDYTNKGWPWYDMYDEDYSTVGTSTPMKNVKNTAAIDGIDETGDSFSIDDHKVQKIQVKDKKKYGA